MIVHAQGTRVEHYGQHGDDCFPCKLSTIHFSSSITSPPTHVGKNGDPWDGNPVQERILELQAQGRRVAAMEMQNPATQENKE